MAASAPIEYVPVQGQPAWKVSRFLPLSADFGLTRKDLPAFHNACATMQRAFEIVRLLYGICPVLVTVETDADYLRVWTRAEVGQKFGLTESQLREQVDICRAVWESSRPQEPTPEPQAPKPKRKSVPTPTPAGPPPAAGSPLLRYGFPPSMFDLPKRDPEESSAERAWFESRLVELQKLFDEPAVSSLARQALLSELLLRRIDTQLCQEAVNSRAFSDLQATKSNTESQYQSMWKQITSVVPWASQVTNRITFAGVLSDAISAVADAKAKGDFRRLDGFYTAFEIQIQLRESVQQDIRYRPGQVAAINEAMRGIWDPAWRRSFSNAQLRLLDEGFKEAAKRVREESNIPLPDLEVDGPAGNYAPLYEPPPEEPPEPIVNVPVENEPP